MFDHSPFGIILLSCLLWSSCCHNGSLNQCLLHISVAFLPTTLFSLCHHLIATSILFTCLFLLGCLALWFCLVESLHPIILPLLSLLGLIAAKASSTLIAWLIKHWSCFIWPDNPSNIDPCLYPPSPFSISSALVAWSNHQLATSHHISLQIQPGLIANFSCSTISTSQPPLLIGPNQDETIERCTWS